jgi:hypothetical protein
LLDAPVQWYPAEEKPVKPVPYFPTCPAGKRIQQSV